ncbi:MAG: hypothetical protein MJ016_03685 [Victivallaceae bacterium]|nr:hypothetical protein [Victivallaceae bacterium]
MKRSFFISFFIASLGFAGCSVNNPEKAVHPLVLPSPAAAPEVQAARIAEYREITKGFPVRGVGLFIGAYDGRISKEKLLDCIEECGFNRIYCFITSETQMDEDLEEFLIAVGKRRIPVEIAMDLFHFYPRKAGNMFLRHVRPGSPGIPEMVKKILELKASSGSAYRNLTGITIAANVHFFNSSNLDYPADGLFVWDENSFGPGLDNDEMMKMTLKMLRELPPFPDDLQLTIGVPDHYSELVHEGKLSCGTAEDFAAVRNPPAKIILLSQGNRPTDTVRRVKDEMTNPELEPGSVILLQRIANHTAVSDAQLRRRDWNDFIRITRYVRDNVGNERNFGGLITGPLVLFKILQMEP